ncbi:UV excision repair protein Rad23 [Fistulina hepatica ATCC 64428]|uniref:UV excision repair protein RAD23 n=1 Tax=Fistulina hepatica ATCC 64428 TaxID=1128425 RepID=A0A0D7AFL8_9AGAR|nr:UV excision repair protein Rad23 [Fistulina hepatica ATCC 64428]
MKVTVKTTQAKVFTVEIEPTISISELKAKIFTEQGYAVESQKVIFAGKVLPDDKIIESCGIKEKDFLVLMISKPKPTPAPAPVPAPAPTTSAPAPSQVPAAPPAEAAQPPAAAPAVSVDIPTASAPAVSVPERAFGDTSSFLSGPALQSTIANMMEMGFPRDQVLRALRASYNNPDRAVEYLFNGIPAHLEAQMAATAPAPAPGTTPTASAPTPASIPAAASTPSAAPAPVLAPVPPAAPAVAPGAPQNLFQLAQQQQQAQQQHSAAAAGGLGAGAGAGGALPDLGALRDNPQVAQLRELMAQNPAIIQPLIQNIAASNPHLAQLLAQNPELVMQLLGQFAAGEDDDMEGDEGGEVPPGTHVVNVTPEENAAIQRLEALGFPRQLAIEAYLACDKNEELAANYLFENGFMD